MFDFIILVLFLLKESEIFLAELDKYSYQINAFQSPPPPPPRETSPTSLCKWDLWTTGFMVQGHLQNMPSSTHLNPKSLVTGIISPSRGYFMYFSFVDILLHFFIYCKICRLQNRKPSFLHIGVYSYKIFLHRSHKNILQSQ